VVRARRSPALAGTHNRRFWGVLSGIESLGKNQRRAALPAIAAWLLALDCHQFIRSPVRLLPSLVVEVPVVPPRAVWPALAACGCAGDLVAQPDGAQRQRHPQERRAAASAAGQLDHEKNRLTASQDPRLPRCRPARPGARRPLRLARREQINVHFDIAGLSPRRIPAGVIGSCGGDCTSSACGAATSRSPPPSAAWPSSMASACPRLCSTTCCTATLSPSSGPASDTPAKPG
jgi:hypothetical protein